MIIDTDKIPEPEFAVGDLVQNKETIYKIKTRILQIYYYYDEETEDNIAALWLYAVEDYDIYFFQSS